jgi:ATP/maltotriose-dependent transcriptional regulator MalT
MIAQVAWLTGDSALAQSALQRGQELAERGHLQFALRELSLRQPDLYSCAGLVDPRRKAEAVIADGPLSRRELEVLTLIAQGNSNQQIAEQLYISVHTVKTHARRIHGKLGVERRTQAVAKAKLLKLC